MADIGPFCPRCNKDHTPRECPGYKPPAPAAPTAELSDYEVDFLMQGWDETAPDIQRGICARFAWMWKNAERRLAALEKPPAELVEFDDDVTREDLWALAQSHRRLADAYRDKFQDAEARLAALEEERQQLEEWQERARSQAKLVEMYRRSLEAKAAQLAELEKWADGVAEALTDILDCIQSSHKCSIGTLENTYESQIDVGVARRWRAVLSRRPSKEPQP